jgi:mRNA interferase MazF
MLISGDVVYLGLGVPEGSEAGMQRPAVVVTANRVLGAGPRMVQVVPLTRTLRGYESEVLVGPDEAIGLEAPSAAQCQHIRAVASTRIRAQVGNVGPVALGQIRDTLGVLLDV